MQQAKMAYRDALKHNPFALEALVELQRVMDLLMAYPMLVRFVTVHLHEQLILGCELQHLIHFCFVWVKFI